MIRRNWPLAKIGVPLRTAGDPCSWIDKVFDGFDNAVFGSKKQALKVDCVGDEETNSLRSGNFV